MARPPRFSHDDILDAAAEAAVRRWRDATVADVAALLDTPPNSVYYRFPSKDALFGSLWLRSIRRFHQDLLASLDDEDPTRAAAEGAVTVVRHSRENPAGAVAMTLYRQADLARLVDGELREQVLHVNDEVTATMVDLAGHLFGRTDPDVLALLAVASQEIPYGLVRRHLRSDVPIPAWLDDVARASCLATLDLGRTEGPSARG